MQALLSSILFVAALVSCKSPTAPHQNEAASAVLASSTTIGPEQCRGAGTSKLHSCGVVLGKNHRASAEDLRKIADDREVKDIQQIHPKWVERAMRARGNLNRNEVLALMHYMTFGAGPINGALWTKDVKIVRQLMHLISGTVSALRKLPLYKGRVFRGQYQEKRHVDRYKELARRSKPLVFWGFTSTSTSKDVAKDFATVEEGDEKPGHVEVVFEIETHSGADVSPYALHTDEREVLIGPSTWFRVERVSTSWLGGEATVYLTEL